MPARTGSSWGDSNAYFDRGLGMTVKNTQHKERIMKAKGLMPLSDCKQSTDDYIHYYSQPDARDNKLPETMVVSPTDVARGRHLIQQAQAARKSP